MEVDQRIFSRGSVELPRVSYQSISNRKGVRIGMITVGGRVTYVDHFGQAREALITAIWGDPESKPAINVVFVSNDTAREDSWGRQIERDSSVVHESHQQAHGNFWRES